jgi:hypothetical protein
MIKVDEMSTAAVYREITGAIDAEIPAGSRWPTKQVLWSQIVCVAPIYENAFIQKRPETHHFVDLVLSKL